MDVAENGVLAISFFQQKQYDLIIMNIVMPLMNGYLASQAIRSIEKRLSGDSSPTATKRVPIIALTALPVNSCKEEWIQAGVDDCLYKPFGSFQSAKESFVLHFLQFLSNIAPDEIEGLTTNTQLFNTVTE